MLEQRDEAKELGASLYQSLFGQLSALESAKASWLLSLDGPFFELPFAALREATWREKTLPNYLIERHALQIVPGAFLLEAAKNRRSDGLRYVGFGDPVYNTADPRFRAGPWYQQRWYGLWPSPANVGQLNRLVASGDEVNRSAQAWRESAGAGATAQVFEGITATRDAFLNALNTQNTSTIHLATHVLNGDTRREQAFLAFSSAPGGSPELLATSEVARLNLRGSLVVMTGCASGTGDVVAGAGILGLTRAWLVAGATAVVATGWAVEDTRSDLLPSFYRHLQEYTAAEALRRSQVEMLHAGNWQADPAYWASYQITGVTR
jgi:CHAT domain-containing protein